MKARPSYLVAAGFASFAAWRIWRDLAADSRISRQFQDHWVELRGIAGQRPVAMHALVRPDATRQGRPIVLLHGYGIGSSYFLRLASVLAQDADVYAPDLPGHGHSDHDARPLTLVELAAALVVWMERLDLPPALLVAHSMGCQVAAEAAARFPGRVAGLVLLGPTSDPAGRTVPRLLARALGTVLFEPAAAVVWGLLDYTRAGVRLLLHEMRQVLEHRIEDVLPVVSVPVLVVRGSRDLLVPLAWAQSVARLSGASAPIVLPGLGHVVQYANPHAVATLIVEFARTLSSPGVRGSHATRVSAPQPLPLEAD